MARPSNMSHQHLPPGASNGQYVKCVGGRIIWTTETPGGVVTEAGANAANSISEATGTTIAEKLANATRYAAEGVRGVIAIASTAETNAGLIDDKAITPKTFANALEAGQIITTTLAVDGGFAATNYGSTEAISGGTANG